MVQIFVYLQSSDLIMWPIKKIKSLSFKLFKIHFKLITIINYTLSHSMNICYIILIIIDLLKMKKKKHWECVLISRPQVQLDPFILLKNIHEYAYLFKSGVWVCFYSFTQNPVEGGQQTLIAAHDGIEVSRKDWTGPCVAQGAIVSACAVYIPARREIPAWLCPRCQFHPKSLLSLCNARANSYSSA